MNCLWFDMFMILFRERERERELNKQFSSFFFYLFCCSTYLVVAQLQKEKVRNGNRQDPKHHAIQQVQASNQIEVVSST